MLMDHVHTKQQAVLDKLKQKRANSLATVPDSSIAAKEGHDKSEESLPTINIKKI